METTRQLYHLQELDTEIEQAEQSLAMKTGQLGDRTAPEAVRRKMTAEQGRLEELKHQRRDAEGQVDDVLTKIKAAEDQLYGGKVTNPKELAGLQHEINSLRARNDDLETRALGIIDLMEAAEQTVAAAAAEYQSGEEAWHLQQQVLAGDIEQLKTRLAGLKNERGEMSGQIDAPALSLYERIRQQKKPAVAKVELGICRACRISLSASALQRARGGQAVQCGTCGRILYIS